ncbi:MAG: EAL domain-containing protein [Campylobacterales bacterium]|nr:EAL domain-containing protein [Campylobacterales bacterium]
MFTEISTNTLSSLKEMAKGISVLYVEDDPLIRVQYLTFLSHIFDSLESAENGEEGLHRALSSKFDIIISDVQMPKMCGVEMIERIKEVYTDQLTLLVSAHKEPDILHKSVQLGIDGYLFKPLDRYQTIETLHKLVSKIVLKRENENYKQHLEEMVQIKTQEALNVYFIDHITSLNSLVKLEKDMGEYPTSTLVELKIRDFKMLNDLYGYDIGNNILVQTASFLKKCVTEEFMFVYYGLYRVSGAHFAILVPSEETKIEQYIHHIIQSFELIPIIINDERVFLEMDAGIVHCGEGLTLSHADAALRKAERNGHIVTYISDSMMIEKYANRLKCRNIIKEAIQENRIIPYYQPIIDNTTGKIKKYEALARLITPEGDVISPCKFIPISKETKMYPMITKIIVESALNDFRDSECSVSINLSIDDIKHPSTKEFLLDQISNFPDPSRIVFELLESEEIGSYLEVVDFFAVLKEFGCGIAIDDFGSGYSSFEHLVNLNVDYIKIDGSLVRHLDMSRSSRVIVESIAMFASKMGIKTIAEFVSTQSISAYIAQYGIDESQGYLFGKPLPFNLNMNQIQPKEQIHLVQDDIIKIVN